MWLIASVLVAGCAGEEPSKVISLNGDITLLEDLLIPKDHVLQMAPGCHLTIVPPASIIAEGKIRLEGLVSSPIRIISTADTGAHKVIIAHEGQSECIIHHVHFENGEIETFDRDVDMRDVHLLNTKPLAWNDAAARLWGGSVDIDSCSISGNNTGEGFLLHDVRNPSVVSSTFLSVPDAVEYISCVNGEISQCTFIDNSDDAIDLNHCERIKITDNIISGTLDRGIEIGSQGYGPSSDILVANNLFLHCKTGVNIKEGSSLTISQCTFFQNDIAIEAVREDDFSPHNELHVRRSAASECAQPLFTDGHSDISIEESYADYPAIDLPFFTSSDIIFLDTSQMDFTILSPVSASGDVIGYRN